MEATVIVTFLVLAQYVLFGVQVGSLRAKHGVKAPATTGHDEFERMNRVHLNTMEQIVVFLPALWIHALYANPLWGAGLGLVFIIGRFVYRAEYLKDPSSRSPGFSMTFIPSAILLIWALVAAVMRLL
ncbi:MAG: MAPEG family protein [Gammaproteobacteria bacterium]|nr:MAPEG family protein [Gammaproteobacteria bacterium]